MTSQPAPKLPLFVDVLLSSLGSGSTEVDEVMPTLFVQRLTTSHRPLSNDGLGPSQLEYFGSKEPKDLSTSLYFLRKVVARDSHCFLMFFGRL